MTKQERINLLSQIDFGEIDGSGDPNLERYFLDNGYWDKIICDKVFFVVGKKGTGKSSIYRMIKGLGMSNGSLIENKDFGDFPFEKLLTLSDDTFTAPNQYQSIWLNLILNDFAEMIARNSKYEDKDNEHLNEISNYVKMITGNNVTDLHRESINRTRKTDLGLEYIATIGRGSEIAEQFGNGISNISEINSRLKNLIIDYFITCSGNTKYIIQFDRLDDNYNQYQDLEKYYQCIISLFKTVYRINQDFRARGIVDAKVILYIRSDIIRELGKRDAESARWDDFCLKINWAIINQDDWNNPLLMQMINKRISTSFKNDSQIAFSDIFDDVSIDLRSSIGENLNVFKYIIELTLHRPRDFIKFCKCIQEECMSSGTLYFRTIKNAEKKYAFWLVNSELANEINPLIKNIDSVYELLRLVGQRAFSLSDFADRYKAIGGIALDYFALANCLYDAGILCNVDMSYGVPRFRSVIRNEGKMDRNMKLIIHKGVWIGLNA